ncbi:MAG TPA: elongation factor G [Gemmataceae bacterium]|nr:elongation factor G [Gemmataceae bacterium]
MSKIDLSKFRNLGIIAHIDAGKTTTTEHLLYYSGATHRLGAVDSGNTTTDYDQEEQERGITIYSACIPFQWRDCTINLIDTPGHVDFTAEVERSLRVLDGAVVVFDAQKGVEAQSETVWRQADKYQVPRLAFINKMDVVGANFENVLEAIRRRLAGNPVAVNVPIGSGSVKDSTTPFSGIIDLLEMQALYYEPADQGKTFRSEPIPDKLRAKAQSWREKLFDQLTQNDERDQLTSAYLEGRAISTDTIRAVLREQTLKGLIQPVLCGSGREHIGIQILMDAVTWYLPNPLDRPPVAGSNPKKKDKEEKRKPDPKEPFCGLVFKIVADVKGELYFLRVYSGTLKANSRPYNPGRDCKEMVSKLYHTEADPRQRTEVSEAVAGDIVAIIGMKESITGDTLCDIQHPILLERIQFAEAVVSRSIEPESSADKDKLISVLNILRKEDPTFTWNTDKDTGQTLMNGMGMLHLEIKQHRMERDFRLKVRVGQPKVSFRETIRTAITVTGECVKHAGQGGLFAKLQVAFEPYKGEESILVQSRLPPDKLPPLFVAAAEQGVRAALDSGELGFPVMNVKAVILDGEMDEQLSNDTAFTAAGADAVHKAMRDNIVLLEPWMKLEVTVPDEFLGPVISDLSARRAEINQLENRDGVGFVAAIVPLSKMFDYADKVRSLSQGRASSSMEPYKYRPAPDDVLRSLLHPDESY